MAPIAGIPFLTYLLKYLQRCDISRFVLSTGYKSEAIIRYFGDDFDGIPVVYAVENTSLGTSGAIRLALSECAEENVFILNGDTYFDAGLRELAQLHTRQNADISVALKEMADFDRYGAIELRNERMFRLKPTESETTESRWFLTTQPLKRSPCGRG
jgi:D-glycero-alpha-D-manno-heptose 1-phosphate guanylyltransferase